MNRTVVVGSSALDYFNLNRNTPKDIDIWTDWEFPDTTGYDSFKVSAEIVDLVKHENGYATPDLIYTIKLSHF